MRTKEFMDKVRKLGYNIQREDRTKHKSIYITIPDDDTEGETETTIADVSTTWEAWGTLHQMEFSGHNEIELMRVIADYLETPLEEREEEKLFIYRLPVDSTQGEQGYLLKQTDYKMVIDYSSKDFVLENRMYQFSEEEVGRYSKIYHGLFDTCIKEEVQ